MNHNRYGLCLHILLREVVVARAITLCTPRVLDLVVLHAILILGNTYQVLEVVIRSGEALKALLATLLRYRLLNSLRREGLCLAEILVGIYRYLVLECIA